MNHWMFNCKEVSRRVSESMDRKTPIYERMGLKMHFLMCKYCTRYKNQMLMLRDAMRAYAQKSPDEPSVTLSPDAKDRIKKALSAK